MKRKLKEIPEFETEDEEREFWGSNDSTEFVDWDKAEAIIFPNLKPSTKTISLRLSGSMLDKIRLIAHKRDVPYQSLIKMFLSEKVEEELKA
jgi:predicted DNA binding CopG/RHH family protein